MIGCRKFDLSIGEIDVGSGPGYFDSSDFINSFDVATGDEEYTNGPGAEPTVEQTFARFYTRDSRVTESNLGFVHGAFNGDGDESNSWQGPKPGSTSHADSARDRENIARARLDSGRLPSNTPRRNAGSDAARRVDEQNKKALVEATRRWIKQRADGQRETNSGNDSGRNEAVLKDTGGLKALPAPVFEGCEFEGVLNKLWLTANGEYIVQFKVDYGSKMNVRVLDETAGMGLIIKVEQI